MNRMYIQHLDRLARKYKILISQRYSINDTNVSEIRDNILSYFQDCYHLKDWLIGSEQLNDDDLHDFISGSVEMSLCREICNSAKHLRLSRAKDPKLASFQHIGVPLALAREYSPNGDSLGFLLRDDTAKYDAFQLAEVCLMQWTTFLRSRSLLPAI